jgi:dTDP-4-dehydrorhamnose reductase
MKIAIIGADGQLGTDLSLVLAKSRHPVTKLTIAQVDITDMDSLSRVLKEASPQLVINTAAFHDLEQCEEEPEKAFAVNALGAGNTAMVCNDIDAVLMHISTDYVFDGEKRAPYLESDVPLPLNVYANSKLSGEHFVRAIARKYYILRVSGIYGKAPCIGKKGMNFVKLMLKLSREKDKVRVVDNEILTPTSTLEISRQADKIIAARAPYGLYHATAEGSCSWYEFAGEIFDFTKPKIEFSKAAPGEFAVKVNRPEYSVLENKGLKDQGINVMRHWKEGLREYLASL